MQEIIEEFQDKVDEIEDFFSMINSIEKLSLNKKDPIEITNADLQSHYSLILNEGLQNTIYSTTFLLLYNLMESSIRQGIEAIYDHISRSQYSFIDLKDEIKNKIISDTRKHVTNEDLKRVINSQIENSIIELSFCSEELFSGNVDHSEIRKVADVFGFSTNTEFELTKHGTNLKIIKNNRNSLAHGNTSFRRLGGNYSLGDLKNYKNETVNYLNKILENIKSFLDEEHYKA